MIELYVFPRNREILNYSPFCAKLEAYLKINNIEYKPKYTTNTNLGPKKKFPFIKDGNKKIGDSTFIIEYLKNKNGTDLDKNLSKEEKAIALAFQILMEDSLAQTMIYYRWVYPAGWKNFSSIVFKGVPKIIRMIVGPQIQKRVKKFLYYHGMGRHTEEEILHIARKGLQALSDYLGTKKFFFGDSITTLDLVHYGVVGNMLASATGEPIRKLAGEFKNLSDLVTRVGKLVE